MLQGYRTVLKGDRLEWSEAARPNVRNGGVPVVVIVLEEFGVAVPIPDFDSGVLSVL